MQPSTEELPGDFKNLSCNSTATATANTEEMKSCTSSRSEWTSSSIASPSTKPHTTSSDPCWDAIQRVKAVGSALSLSDLLFVHRLGSGDIGSVFLVELKGSKGCMFAAKVMDKKELATRNKESRERIEREILQMLDHPFLPTLYATLDSSRWSCLLTEFCPGGDLHVLRQRQPEKRFDEAAVRFYASEVVAALEYLHMLGIIYRDLKPENVLVRSDGHIMLTDFDLSLKGDDSSSTAQIAFDQDPPPTTITSNGCPTDQSSSAMSACILPNCIAPAVSCFHPKRRRKKRPTHGGSLEFIAEPIEMRSMSFVGTHEYLAPEIVSGEGHGNAVDWWTLGIFIFELLYGMTPFKGLDNEFTLANIVARALEFPKEPVVPGSAKDLITQLLVKDPAKRLGSTMGATSIKHHSFFNGVNWALLRCESPPYTPPPVKFRDLTPVNDDRTSTVEYY